jgi:hypothetical protein
MTGSAAPYSQVGNLTVLPQPYSTGTGGNTAQYASTGVYTIHGGKYKSRRTNRKRDLYRRRQRTLHNFNKKSRASKQSRSFLSFLGL